MPMQTELCQTADWHLIFQELSSDELENTISAKKKLFISDLDVNSINTTENSSLTLVPNSSTKPNSQQEAASIRSIKAVKSECGKKSSIKNDESFKCCTPEFKLKSSCETDYNLDCVITCTSQHAWKKVKKSVLSFNLALIRIDLHWFALICIDLHWFCTNSKFCINFTLFLSLQLVFFVCEVDRSILFCIDVYKWQALTKTIVSIGMLAKNNTQTPPMRRYPTQDHCENQSKSKRVRYWHWTSTN